MSITWRLVLGAGSEHGPDDLCADGARNMAVDHVLFDTAKRTDSATVRLYRWSPACLSLGRNQPARARYHGVPGRDIVRRPTGGLAVYHDQEMTYSVTCPVGAIGAPRATYRRVHEALAHGLASLGARTYLADAEHARTPAPRDPEGVCFRSPADGEVVAEAGKLVGSAQRCEDRTILQHGSILIDGSQDRASALGGKPPSTGAPPAGAEVDAAVAVRAETTLSALLGRRPADAELVDALVEALRDRLGIRLAPASLTAAERAALDRAEAHFRSEAWTWRS